MATAEELQSAVTALNAAISAAKSEAAAATATERNTAQIQVNEAEKRLQQALSLATASIKKTGTDAELHCKEEVHQLHNAIRPKLESIEPLIDEASKALDAKIAAVEMKADRALALDNKIDQHRVQIVQELAAVKEELVALIDQTATKAAEALKRERKALDKILDEMRKLVQENADQGKASASAELTAYIESQRALDHEQDERAQRAQSEIYLRLDRLDAALEEAAEKAETETKDAVEKADMTTTELRSYADSRLNGLDVETERLRNAMSEVENISTRRVEWVVKNVSSRLKPGSAEKASLHTSWFSPKFDAAGAYGLQLELQLFRPSDPPVEDEQAGDCAVFLWASKGMSLSYKLYIGGKSQTLEKVFNGRVPYGTKRFCWLREQVNRQEDSLRIGVEILEAVREVEHIIKPPPPREIEGVEGGEVQPDALEGLVLMHRHVNNRMLDQVKTQVERMNSRMVRRIEWRVEQAAMLRRCFPPGEPICCKPFNAAGIEGMQLVFYPSGYKGATDGFCSLFLWCPAGASLKCWLHAGAQRRDATHAFGEPGAFGRTNFARFESVVSDDEDTVLIVLEVEEAHQDVVAKVAHPSVVAGDTRSQGQIEGASNGPINSVVKMKKVPGKPVPGLEDVRILPSLWSAKPVGDVGAPADGYHTMAELRKMARTSGAAPKQAGLAGAPSSRQAKVAQRSESLPALGASGSPAAGSYDDDLAATGGSWRRDKRQGGRRGRGKDPMSMTGTFSMAVA